MLAYTRDCPISGTLCTNQYYSLRTHSSSRHPISSSHRPHYCAIQCLPPTPRYCNIYHTIMEWLYRVKAKRYAYAVYTTSTLLLYSTSALLPLGLYSILPLPILYGMYCNKGWSRGNAVLHNSVGDEGGVGCPNKGGVCD